MKTHFVIRGYSWILLLTLIFLTSDPCHSEDQDCSEPPCYDSITSEYDDGMDDEYTGPREDPGLDSGSSESSESGSSNYSLTNDEEGEVNVTTFGEWVRDILRDVTYLNKESIPGEVFAFGARSFPVLLGKSDIDALVVAAEFGQGRIVATSGSNYANKASLYDHGCIIGSSQGARYTGTQFRTATGIECQRWDEQTPHAHEFTQDLAFPDATVSDAANYCRNPDGSVKPWCLTSKPELQRMSCEIPQCVNPTDEGLKNQVQFQDNVKQWLSRGRYVDSRNMCDLRKVQDLSCLDDANVTVAVWDHLNDLATLADNDKMRTWIQNGGGLFYSLTPWIWMHYTHKGKRWTEIPYYNVLKEAGIGFADRYADVADGKYMAKTSDADIAVLHNLNIYYMAKKLKRLNQVKNKPLLNMMLKIIEDEMSILYTPEMRKDIARPLLPFAEAMESVVKYPSGTVTATKSSSENSAMLMLYTSLNYMGMWRDKAPNVDKFPGDAEDATPTFGTYQVNEATKQNFWFTGYYLLPGDELRLVVLSEEDDSWKDFVLYIGIHTDRLTSKTWLKRFPTVVRQVPLLEMEIKVTSWFGGLVFLKSPGGKTSSIRVALSGVVKAPYYKLGNARSVREWKTNRQLPAPWTVLEGEKISIVIQSEGIRTWDDPAPGVQTWDRVVATDFYLAGYPESQQRHQWFVTDIQIIVGSLHAGIPIMAHIHSGYGDPSNNKFVLRTDGLESQWGFFHEVGHNMQRASWNLDGGTECNVNVFSMLQMEYSAKSNPYDPGETGSGWWNRRIREPQIGQLLKTGDLSIYKKNPWTCLLSYAQLYEQFGWECYRQVFLTYEYDNLNNSKALPTTNKDEYNQWVIRWSKVIGYNLSPLFDLWAYPLTQKTYDQLKHLTPYVPRDNVTSLTEGAVRLAEIESRFPGLIRELPSKPACYRPTYLHKKEMEKEILQTKTELEDKLEKLKEEAPIIKLADDHKTLSNMQSLREKFEQFKINRPR